MWGWVLVFWDLMIDSWRNPKPDARDVEIEELEKEVRQLESLCLELLDSEKRFERENYLVKRQLEVTRTYAKAAQERFFVGNDTVTWIKDDYGNN